METHRELNLALGILVTVRAANGAERRVETKSVPGRRHSNASTVNCASSARAGIERVGFTKNLGAIEQVKGLSEQFKIISLREVNSLRNSQVHILDRGQTERVTWKPEVPEVAV